MEPGYLILGAIISALVIFFCIDQGTAKQRALTRETNDLLRELLKKMDGTRSPNIMHEDPRLRELIEKLTGTGK